jgi:NAD(P)-dependent dehydrogenase (short-subunit alcohol dehydrogenase family)
MAALNMLVRCSALENAKHGIRINAIAPSCIRSARVRTATDAGFKGQLTPSQNSEYLMEQAKSTPLLQFAKPVNKPLGHYIY